MLKGSGSRPSGYWASDEPSPNMPAAASTQDTQSGAWVAPRPRISVAESGDPTPQAVPVVQTQAIDGLPVTSGQRIAPESSPAMIRGQWSSDAPCAAQGDGSAARPGFCTRFKCWMQRCFLGFPEEFHEPALGAFANANANTQAANGEAALMCLYHYDFIEGSDHLNPRGRERLAKITGMLPINFAPVVIERTIDAPQLDERRRMHVWAELANGRFPVPSERVVVGLPTANGLQGMEAIVIYRNQLTNTLNLGITLGGAGGGGQGFGSGSGSGSGSFLGQGSSGQAGPSGTSGAMGTGAPY
jgi:hypothetical protein